MDELEQRMDYDPQLLERVWARVLQGRAEGDGVGRRMPPEEERRPAVGQPEEPPTLHRREPVCFGPENRNCERLLEQMLEGEWEDMRIYRSMARQAGGTMARTLGELARQEREHAGRLGAAWFIITGRQFRWSGHGESRPPVALPMGLREQYLQEQREAEAYGQVAREMTDPCMRALFEDLAGQEREHARAIYSLLERM